MDSHLYRLRMGRGKRVKGKTYQILTFDRGKGGGGEILRGKGSNPWGEVEAGEANQKTHPWPSEAAR